MSEEYKLLKRNTIHNGVVIDYYQDEILLPNGNKGLWDIVDHKGAAAVLPVLENGNLLMVRQYRYALGRYTIEIPAGGLNSREEPMIEAAARELQEETGLKKLFSNTQKTLDKILGKFHFAEQKPFVFEKAGQKIILCQGKGSRGDQDLCYKSRRND